MIPSKISIRLEPEERAALEIMAKEDDWSNISGFIKYKLFGKEAKQKIKTTDEDLATYLKYEVCELTERTNLTLQRISDALYTLDLADNEAWKNKIASWLRTLSRENEAFQRAISRIARRLHMKEFFERNIDIDNFITQGLMNHRASFVDYKNKYHPDGSPSPSAQMPLITFFATVSQEPKKTPEGPYYFQVQLINKDGQRVYYDCYTISSYSEIMKLKIDDYVCISGYLIRFPTIEKQGKVLPKQFSVLTKTPK